jgi:hypothetical protein
VCVCNNVCVCLCAFAEGVLTHRWRGATRVAGCSEARARLRCSDIARWVPTDEGRR